MKAYHKPIRLARVTICLCLASADPAKSAPRAVVRPQAGLERPALLPGAFATTPSPCPGSAEASGVAGWADSTSSRALNIASTAREKSSSIRSSVGSPNGSGSAAAASASPDWPGGGGSSAGVGAASIQSIVEAISARSSWSTSERRSPIAAARRGRARLIATWPAAPRPPAYRAPGAGQGAPASASCRRCRSERRLNSRATWVRRLGSEHATGSPGIPTRERPEPGPWPGSQERHWPGDYHFRLPRTLARKAGPLPSCVPGAGVSVHRVAELGDRHAVNTDIDRAQAAIRHVVRRLAR